MKRPHSILGLALCAASCATVPDPAATGPGLGCPLPGGPAALTLRIGVEVLDDAPDAPRLEQLARPAFRLASRTTTTPREATPARPANDGDIQPVDLAAEPAGWRQRGAWDYSDEALADAVDRNERASLRFLHRLRTDDGQHILHSLGGAMLLGAASEPPDWSLWTSVDQRRLDDRAEFEHIAIRRLIRRPLRDAALEISPFGGVQKEVDRFRRDHLQLVDQPDARGFSLGRLTGRLRPGRGIDSVELAWVRSGLRIGSSLQRMRIGAGVWITEGVHCGANWARDLVSGRDDVRFDLDWQIEPRHRLRLQIAQDVAFPDSFLAGQFGDRRREGQRPDSEFGVLFYVERLF